MRLGLGIGLNRGRSGGAQGPANTVAPAITGTAERGELLSCSTGTWTGTGTIAYTYQWRRNGTPISGATSNTYTLIAADDNANISCIVTATDDEGSRSASSNTVGPVLGSPFLLTAPVLSGTETVGQTLSVTDGTWQGVATITFAYQWRRNGSNISGATSNTYTLVAADYDAVIDCVVTATNSIDSATAASNDTGAIAGLSPTNDTAPSISGNTGLGDTLTRTEGTWSGVPTPSVTGQWRRNGVAISGETGATYTIAEADSGADIDYLETATNAEGSATADSNNITAQTFAAPTIGAGLSIAGTEEVGSTLTATAAAVTGNPTPVRTWQWQRSADGSTGWADISGATSSTYTLDAADENNYVRVKQIETNALGSDEAVSAATGEITASTATGILDSYTGAAFAAALDVLLYSSHSVTDSAVGSATEGQTGQYTVRVRRSSDNAVSSFTYTEVSDGTLTTWVGAGNDGFVEAWYEQSTNGNHATQSTAASQPKIVDAGSLVVENGKAALDFTLNYLDALFPNVTSLTSIWVGYQEADGSNQGFFETHSGSVNTSHLLLLSNTAFVCRSDAPSTATNNINYPNFSLGQIISFSTVTNAEMTNRINDQAEETLSYSNGFQESETGLIIGALKGLESSYDFTGRFQCLILFPSNMYADRSNITTAINTEYNIY